MDGPFDGFADGARATFGQISAGACRFVGYTAKSFTFWAAERRGSANESADRHSDGARCERRLIVEVLR
jgi:hypothetical protein